ncbi:hypothetical protein CC2G_012505 [Coprinopsis cinerea AmutBmut pab1-1]|nr:hypothetical protein CC2G_012505 [Coprinopsis cinerea AmutBmut pab1-1]
MKTVHEDLRSVEQMVSSGVSQVDIDIEVAALRKERKELLSKLKTLALRICDLHSQRNELAHISQFPNELLQKVFLLLRGAQPSNAGYHQVIRLTHVCRRWRQVGLNQPELWAYITDDQPDNISTLLERSKSVPLTMSLYGRYNQDDIWSNLWFESKIWGALSQRILQSVGIRSPFENLVRRVQALPAGAPSLHTLHLTNSSDTTRSDTWTTAIPDILTAGAPLLRDVYLRDCHLPWATWLFQRLTSLEIYDRHASAATSAAEFLDALERMPELERLRLDVKIPKLNKTATTKNRLVALPALKSLHIEGGFRECHDFLGHVVLPRTANLELSMDYSVHGERGNSSTIREFSLLPRILPCHSGSTPSPHSPPPSNEHQEITFTQSKPLSLIIDTQGYPSSLWLYPRPERLDPFTRPDRSNLGNVCYAVHNPTDNGRAIFRALPSTDIRSLSITMFDHSDSAELGAVLSFLPSVEELRVGEMDGLSVLDALCGDPGLDDSNGPLLRLPALKTLVFECVSILSRPCPCIDVDAEDIRPFLFDDLLSLLKARAVLGSKLEKLQFEVAYNLTASQVARLETVAEVVVWSGIEQVDDMRCGSGREDCTCKNG